MKTSRVVTKEHKPAREIDIDYMCCAGHECMSGHVDTLLQFAPPDVTLPFIWSPDSDGSYGSAVSDPLTLYVHLPFGEDGPDGDSVDWSISLCKVIDDFVDAITIYDGSNAVADDEREKVQTIANALRSEAERLEEILKRKPKAENV